MPVWCLSAQQLGMTTLRMRVDQMVNQYQQVSAKKSWKVKAVPLATGPRSKRHAQGSFRSMPFQGEGKSPANEICP